MELMKRSSVIANKTKSIQFNSIKIAGAECKLGCQGMGDQLSGGA